MGASVSALACLVLAGMMPWVEREGFSTPWRLLLALLLTLCAAGIAGLAVWLVGKAKSAPKEADAVSPDARKQAKTVGLLLSLGQAAVMASVAVYGFSADQPLLAYGGVLAAVCFGGVAMTLLRGPSVR